MFGIGSTELLVILLVALIVLGPKSLASVSRSLGKAMGEFRRVSTDFQRTLNMEAAEQDMRDAERKRKAAQGVMNGETAPQENKPEKESASQTPDLPADSPLAQALARARTSAETGTEHSDNCSKS